MGVQGLWQLLHPAGKPVSPSSLEGKVLAVDVSIWLHQTLKGMRDKDGNPLPNAHLQGLFTRICKLLFYHIRPVFVFDGGAPALKKQTLALRRERKEQVDKEKGRTTQKLLQNLLRTHAVGGALGEGSVQIDIPSKREPDIFQLPPIPEVDKDSADPLENAGAWEIDFDREETRRRRPHLDIIQSLEDNLQNLDDIDFESPEFENLPPEVKHEILTEMKEQRKERALARFVDMPEVSEDFSSFQLKKLIKQSKLSGKIESVRKEMNERTSGDITYALGDDYYGEVVEANRVVSEDASHYILIKGLTRKQQMAQAEKCKVEVISDEEAQGDFGQEGRKGRSMQTGNSASNKRVKFEDEESTDSHQPKHSQACDNTLGCVLDDDFNSDIDVSPVPKKKIKQEKTSDDEELETKQNSDDDIDSFDDKFSARQKKIKDELSSDDEEIKTRRQRRGKALLKRNSSGELGVNNAAKNRKGKIKPRCKKIPVSVNSFPFITSKDAVPITVKTAESEVDISTVAAGEKLASNGNEMVDCVGPTIGNGEGDSDVMEAENDDFEETRQKLISEEEELNREREAKMAALMKSLEKRTEISAFSSQLSPPESQPLEEEKSTEETIEKLLLEEERLAQEKESKMAALLQSIEKRSKLKSAQDLAIDTSSLKNETQSETENDVHDTEQTLKSSSTLPLQRGKGEKEVGFLEDVAKAEKKIIHRRNRSKHSRQEVEARSESNHSKRVVPGLTVEYLEDVESMLDVQNENTSISSPVENTNKVSSDKTVDLDQKPKDDGPEMTVDNLDNLTSVQEPAIEKPRKGKQKMLTERAKADGWNMKRKRVSVSRRGTATVEAAAKKKAKIGEPWAEPVRISAETEESEA